MDEFNNSITMEEGKVNKFKDNLIETTEFEKPRETKIK